jgi:hypothetical protein
VCSRAGKALLGEGKAVVALRLGWMDHIADAAPPRSASVAGSFLGDHKASLWLDKPWH